MAQEFFRNYKGTISPILKGVALTPKSSGEGLSANAAGRELKSGSHQGLRQSMNLKKAELIVEEFNKVALVESAEVVLNSEGDWSIRITATFRDLSMASRVLGTARAEEDFGTM